MKLLNSFSSVLFIILYSINWDILMREEQALLFMPSIMIPPFQTGVFPLLSA